MTSKQELRKSILQQRAKIARPLLPDSGNALVSVAQPIINSITHPTTIALYISMGTEISTLELIHTLLLQRHTLLIPKLGTGKEIFWSELNSVEQLNNLQSINEHRPLEVHSNNLLPEELNNASHIFIPALAIDQQGNRLGRGAAWYDQALLHRNTHAQLYAICWDWELLPSVPTQKHDVPVQGAITNKQIVHFA
ncbi:MAG: 5-formyltetrahydrofolate cyclo-ligase [Bifidobacteriaceae bacterium]|nr:5-formyltetrahydrofolate cyclo-ligase [Bifidobacteriaceae bacterium]